MEATNKKYRISVIAEDQFAFYVKTDKTPEEIVRQIESIPEDVSWLCHEYTEAERINDEFIRVHSGITDKICFTVICSDKEGWFDAVSDEEKGNFYIEDISELAKNIKKALGVEDIKLSSDKAYRGLTIRPIPDDYYFHAELEEKTEEFCKNFLKLGNKDYYLENEKELLEAAKNENEKEIE